jgi:hypothetical protein
MNRSRLIQYFDTLAETPDAVAKLRNFVLSLAVRGQQRIVAKVDELMRWCDALEAHLATQLLDASLHQILTG